MDRPVVTTWREGGAAGERCALGVEFREERRARSGAGWGLDAGLEAGDRASVGPGWSGINAVKPHDVLSGPILGRV